MLKLYGIRSCDTCRKARKWLDRHGIEHEYHDLRDDGVEERVLVRWTGRMDWQKFVNKRSLTWRRIPEVDRESLDRKRAIAMLLEHPTLIKRPVLDSKELIAVGFSPDNYRKMFDSL
ncbi:MAG: Spx/MgsR family RNA polymerase-binding regulatory protein [Gammaproteobacteria bacterium]|nr:Spx/MgsR family RNA polymerase-binding regulatory protein [Gammaproteobacteria bacterium]MDH4252949.1 Spx/MgsR family RNA polymerase-binding regulatory protein [Gammaproteobacteria bacterium]MDH5308365.1 Spx/MgsR family RNA polymerase-binding regulatory protein [Gammaproteobacteria bacterium]